MAIQALSIHGAGDLRLNLVEDTEPQAGEVLVRIEAGGICGSDLHYYLDGGFGAVRLREPMILGHEVSGTVASVGAEVAEIEVGDRVAINPSRPCGHCEYCEREWFNHCRNMRFYGSAMPFPHVQGAFREELVVDPRQCAVYSGDMDASTAAFAEPLSVLLHAANRFGELEGRDLLITGCGPIGALGILVARQRGARRIVVTDIAEGPLKLARELGADLGLNVARDPEALNHYVKAEGLFQGMWEASGNGKALSGAIESLEPRSRIIQIGLGGDVTLPLNRIAAKELELHGTFRFFSEFFEAVQLLEAGAIKVRPLLTKVFPLEKAEEAFQLAADRDQAMKVQLKF